MKRSLFLISLLIAAVPVALHLGGQQNAAPDRALVDRYCVGCHNQRAKIGGLALDNLEIAQAGEHAEVWEKVVRKLRGGLMPPPGSPRPAAAEVNTFVAALEGSLDRYAAANPDPGSVAVHRLNRAEYAASIKQLFGIDIDAAALLPVDDLSEGFDNIASVLKVSPSFIDQYIAAAQFVAKEAVGKPVSTEPQRVTLRGGVTGDPYGPGGVPLGSRALLLVDYLFPADGEYEFSMAAPAGRGGGRAAAPNFLQQGPGAASANIVTLDGVKVAMGQRIKVTAGVHKIGLSTNARSFAEGEAALQSLNPGGGGGGRGGGGGAGALTVAGPYDPTSPFREPPNRAAVFTCKPPNAAEEAACASSIFKNLARRAFRRPVSDAEIQGAMAFYNKARAQGDFEAGIEGGLVAILASPKFLYRSEPVPPGTQPGSIVRVTDLELASRLSYFLWSAGPDEELLRAAEAQQLSNPAELEKQVKRMLGDPRAAALIQNFAFQWLKLRPADEIAPDPIQYPNFDNGLRQAFRTEMEMFLSSLISEDRSALDLLRADYTFVNERLAIHYGVPDIRGDRFRRVTLTDPNRFGLLGKGSVLMVTSYPNRTAPVLRGAWILENLLGTPPAAPPPDVEGFRENKEGEKALTVREIMELHRAKPSCNSCHGVMDPLGFALENYDAIGAWRTKDRWAQTVIDAGGKLVDGTDVTSPADLNKALLARPQQLAQTVTEKMMLYGLGRTVEARDMPVVRQIVRDAARQDYKFSAIVLGIVRSAPFQSRKLAPAQVAAR